MSGYEIFCPKCRTAVAADAEHCPNCGEHLLVTEQQREEEWRERHAREEEALQRLQEQERERQQPPLLLDPTVYPPSAPTDQIRYGGFWIRVLAYVVDGVLLTFVAFVLRLVLGLFGAFLTILIDWIYFAGLESSTNQATIGKGAVGLRVTDEFGRRISFGRATGRYFAKILSALILLVGFMMVGWTRRKQGLHDLIAGTLVLRR